MRDVTELTSSTHLSAVKEVDLYMYRLTLLTGLRCLSDGGHCMTENPIFNRVYLRI